MHGILQFLDSDTTFLFIIIFLNCSIIAVINLYQRWETFLYGKHHYENLCYLFHVTDGHLFVNKAPCITFNLCSCSSTDHLMSEFTKAACDFLIPTSSTMVVYQPQVVKTTLMIPWKWLGWVQYWDPPSGQMVMRQHLQRVEGLLRLRTLISKP